MKNRRVTILLLLFCFFVQSGAGIFAQSRPQRPDSSKSNQKKNQRPTQEELDRQAEEKKRLEEEKNAIIDDDVLTIDTNIVNVDAVVFDKKSKQIITGLKKENFAVFENGVKQDISNFAEPEAPITVTLVVEYSKWSEVFGYAGSNGFDYGHLEVVRPVAYFLSKFIKPPGDFASVIAFDLRPTPKTVRRFGKIIFSIR
jgi:hypothetical protein